MNLDLIGFHAEQWLPAAATLLGAIIVVALTRRFLLPIRDDGRFRLPRQLFTIITTLIAIIAVILLLPVNDSAKNQLLSVFGLIVTATIALSSTTFIGNVMSGIMLRTIRNIKAGDFLKVNDHFGRVTERGLLRTEIQTEFRDLTTIPNLYLITNPVTIVQQHGTIVTADVSLGYDVPHERVEEALLHAITAANLDNPFVRILELGDFSITYRAAGFLVDTKNLLSVRSELRKAMLNALHGQGIEIVSPSFMNQRQLADKQMFIPKRARGQIASPDNGVTPEDVIFDKAERAQERESILTEIKSLDEAIEALAKDSTPDLERQALELKQKKESLAKRLADLTETEE